MCSEYIVQLDGSIVGSAKVTREGLYLHIVCKCTFAESGLYKIEAEGPSGTVNLGTCVQRQESFGLDTRVPVKHLGIGELVFRVLVPPKNKEQVRIPISEREAFAYIAKLRNARLIIQSGKRYIELRE